MKVVGGGKKLKNFPFFCLLFIILMICGLVYFLLLPDAIEGA